MANIPEMVESGAVVDGPKEMSADDFILGLFAALTGQGVTTVSMREEKFYDAISASFLKLKELAASHPGQVEVAFRIKLDPLYGDSAVVRNAVNAAVQRTFLSLDNPEFVTIRSKLDKVQAQKAIEHLPGDPGWYESLATEFLKTSGRTAA